MRFVGRGLNPASRRPRYSDNRRWPLKITASSSSAFSSLSSPRRRPCGEKARDIEEVVGDRRLVVVERILKKIEPTKPPQKRHWQVAFEPTKNNPKSPFRNPLNSESYSRYSCESCLCSIEHNFQKTGGSTPRTALKWAVHSHSTHISPLPIRTTTTRNVPLSAAELE